MLSDEDINKIVVTFRGKLAQFGMYSPKAVYWRDEFSQYTRYKVFTDIGNLEGSSILDVGCGVGDLYFYLTCRLQKFRYMGIDITDEMIQAACKKYPDAHFKTKSLEAYEGPKFDYVFVSGIFSLKVPQHKQKYFQLIRKLYTLSKKASAFNMLRIGGHPDDQTFAAYDPEEVRRFCSTFAGSSQLVTDYLPQDFTVYLYH